MVQGYLNPNLAPPSPVPPAEPLQQVMRGSAGGAEDGGQWDDPTQQQMHRGGSAGWGSSPFSSTDVREKKDPVIQKMSPSSLISLMNKLCKQKPAGSFCLPKVPDSDYCLICNQGSTCLGAGCKGIHQQIRIKATSANPNPDPTPSIPGLVFSSAPLTVLKRPTKSSVSKHPISALSPRSTIFNSNLRSARSPTADTGIETPSKTPRTPKSKASKRLKTTVTFSSNLRQKLKNILLRTPPNPSKTKGQVLKKEPDQKKGPSSIKNQRS